MSLKSKLSLENPLMFAASMFYLVAGMIFFYELALEPSLFHMGLLGILSIVSAYGTFRMRRWTLWFVVALFILGTSFAVIQLCYTVATYSFFPDMELGLFNVALIVYVALVWFFSIYVMARRKMLEY